MKTTQNIIPVLATHPGQILLDEIVANEYSQSQFAKQIGYNKSQLNEIIKGKRGINADLALILEKALGIDAEYWLEVQKNYDLDVARIKQKSQKRLEAIEQWKFIEDKIAFAFLKKEKILTGDPVEDIQTVKKVYAVQNFEQLASINAQPAYTRFRKSTQLKINPVNIIGWVKLVHYKASKSLAGKFDLDQKDELIQEVKKILRKNNDTLAKVKEALSDYGIKLIYQNKGEKTPVDGVSFWSNGNPAVGISLRHKRLDNYAFTLFHELGHIYEHLPNSNKAEFIDLISTKEQQDYKNSTEEKEANSFAQNQLIDPEKWNNFFEEDKSFTDKVIEDFAEEIGIHPCIVRGRVCYARNFYQAKTNINYSIC